MLPLSRGLEQLSPPYPPQQPRHLVALQGRLVLTCERRLCPQRKIANLEPRYDLPPRKINKYTLSFHQRIHCRCPCNHRLVHRSGLHIPPSGGPPPFLHDAREGGRQWCTILLRRLLTLDLHVKWVAVVLAKSIGHIWALCRGRPGRE